jgi:transcription elongation factor GreA
MTTSKQIIVTEEGMVNIKSELEHLIKVRRKEITETIKNALSFGDLSENSEYDEAKNEQARVEARIAELEDTVKNAVIISEADINTDTVGIGSKVTVQNIKTGKEASYYIVGSTEADPFKQKISDESPVGKAIIGAKRGDIAEIPAPSGVMSYKIIDISK